MLLLQWLLKLSDAGVGLDERFGSYQAKVFEAALSWALYRLIHITQQARSELDSFWMKQNGKMCPRSLPNALQLLVGTRSVQSVPNRGGTAWCQVLSTELSRLRQALRSRGLGRVLPSLQCKVLLGRIWLFYIRSGSRAFEVFERLPLTSIGFVAGPNDLVVIWKGMFRDFSVMRKCYHLKNWVQIVWSVLKWKWASCHLLESFCPCRKNHQKIITRCSGKVQGWN